MMVLKKSNNNYVMRMNESMEHIGDNSCVKEMIEIGNEYNAEWFTVGKRSVKGHPHHPLYLKNNSPVESFDIENYVYGLFSDIIKDN